MLIMLAESRSLRRKLVRHPVDAGLPVCRLARGAAVADGSIKLRSGEGGARRYGWLGVRRLYLPSRKRVPDHQGFSLAKGDTLTVDQLPLLEGRQPIELTPTRLLRLSKDLPHDWSEQRHVLGFAA
jgi:hypothetical protein